METSASRWAGDDLACHGSRPRKGRIHNKNHSDANLDGRHGTLEVALTTGKKNHGTLRSLCGDKLQGVHYSNKPFLARGAVSTAGATKLTQCASRHLVSF